MKIALAGPVRVGDLAPWLDVDDPTGLPPGLGTTPVTALARGLLRRGHRISLVTLDFDLAREVVFEGPQLRLRVQPFRDAHRGRDAYRQERRALEAALLCEAPDLIHAHWSYEYALAALRTGLPTLVTVRDWAPTILRWMPDPYRFVRLGMFVRTTMKAPYLTTLSPYMASRLERWRRGRIRVIPNGLDDSAFDGTPRQPNSTSPLLVAVNTGFTPWKNVKRLLQAFRRVRQSLPATRLVLLGYDHGPGQAAERWATEHDLTRGVEFVGQTSYARTGQYLARADLLVHPSLEESFGMVILEAMARGLPVVAGRRSGAVPWVTGSGRAGLLTDVTSPHAIAEAVVTILSDQRRWARASRDGYERASTHFRLDNVLDSYVDAYQRLLADRMASPVSASGARHGHR